MDHQDRDLILGLANRLRQAPPVPQDPQAAELIAQQIASQPNSIYLLVQAVLVQDDALRQAQARIAAMGAAHQNPGYAPQPGYAPNPAFAPQPGYGLQPGYAPNPGYAGNPAFTSNSAFANPAFTQQPGYGQAPAARGSFMKTAAAAAAGVAGGALLVAGVNELFSDDQPNHAQAQGGHEGGEDEGFGVADLF